MDELPQEFHQSSTGLLLVISGPSGVGKTTIVQHVRHELDAVFSVSLTTRQKTAADIEGESYYFVSEDEFRARRDAGELLEWAEVYQGCFYGTPREFVTQAIADGRIVILEIDVEGAVQVRENMPDAYMIFIMPPSEEELLGRLKRRKRESEDQIARRFAKAQWEIQRARTPGLYDAFVVNDDLNKAQQQAVEAVEKAWHSRRQSEVE